MQKNEACQKASDFLNINCCLRRYLCVKSSSQAISRSQTISLTIKLGQYRNRFYINLSLNVVSHRNEAKFTGLSFAFNYSLTGTAGQINPRLEYTRV